MEYSNNESYFKICALFKWHYYNIKPVHILLRVFYDKIKSLTLSNIQVK